MGLLDTIGMLLARTMAEPIRKASEKLQKEIVWTEDDDKRVKNELAQIDEDVKEKVNQDARDRNVSAMEEAVGALVNLGYSKKEATNAVDYVITKTHRRSKLASNPSSEIVTDAMQYLNKK